jgi:MFS family permease
MTIPFQKLLAVTLLFSSSFAWFFAFYTYFDDIFTVFNTDTFWLILGNMLFLISVVVSAVFGSVIAGRVNRRKLLFLWIVFEVLVILPLPFFRGTESLVFFSILAGASFGVGFPSCMAFLADSSTADERGRVSGLALLVTFVLVFLAILANSVLGFPSGIGYASQPVGLVLTAVVVRLIGFLSFLFDPIQRRANNAKPWRSILGRKDFGLYTFAFVFFNIAAGLVAFIWLGLPKNPDYESIAQVGNILRYVGLGVFGVIAGIAADRIGRKRPIILGLMMLGVGYALIGLITNATTYLANFLLSGFAWGIIMVIYLVVPGDLAFPGSEERFYASGWVLPLMLYIGINGAARFVNLVLPLDVFSTILSIILFASIVPIWSAAETLSESKIQERRLREYAEKVGKEVQEYKESDQS